MSHDEYNGWPNRETWALNLWLSHDETIYNTVLEQIPDALAAYTGPLGSQAFVLGEAIEEWFFSVLIHEMEPSSHIINILTDIGSRWRIHSTSIGEAWLEAWNEHEPS